MTARGHPTPLALDHPGGPPATVYEPHVFGPHPGFLTHLSMHPAWAPPTPALSDNAGYSAPALSVQVFENATLARSPGMVFDHDGRLVPETISAQRWFDPELQQVADLDIANGTHAALSDIGKAGKESIEQPLLFTNYGGYTVFGHYIFETLTSLWALRSSIAAGSAKILMAYSNAAWPDHLLDVLGVPREARFQTAASNLICRTLAVASSCSGLQTFYPMPRMHEMVDDLKTRCRAAPGKARLYLTRQGAETTSGRFISNELELVEGLNALGFVAIDASKCTFDQQVRIFGQAEAVVGVHGSAFGNIVFSQPNTLVVDLLPAYLADGPGRWVRNITHAFEQRYFYVICESRVIPQGHLVTIDVPATVERIAAALDTNGF